VDIALHPMLSMDARLLLCWHPTDIYQVCVLAPGFAWGWTKIYSSKQACITELQSIDLLTPDDVDVVLASDFEVKDRILFTNVNTDPEILEGAGFAERVPDVVN
jgi:hypothetical protein